MKSSVRPAIDSAFACFEELEATSSKLSKESILRKYSENKTLQYLVKLGLDSTRFHVVPKPINTYNAKNISGVKSKSGFKSHEEAHDAFKLLASRLSTRKITGADAVTALSIFLASCGNLPLAQKWYHRVLCKKLRCGIDTTIQKVWPGLIIPFGVPKGASLMDQKKNKVIPKVKAMIRFDKGPVISQPKCDGIHGIANVEQATFQSSSGGDLPNCFPIAELLKAAIASVKLPKQFRGYAPLISGECLAKYDPKKDGKRWNSVWGKGGALAKLGNSVNGYDAKRITAEDKKLFHRDFYFEIYDIYPEIAHIQEVDLEYADKVTLLEKIIRNASKLAPKFGLRSDVARLIDMAPCYSWKDIERNNEIWIKRGYEGSILRVPGMKTLANSKWRGCFVKYKRYAYVDAVILGVVEGKKNTKNEGKGGSFLTWLPAKKSITKVTIPTDAAKDKCLKYAKYLPGAMIEASQQDDAGGDVAVSRFPIMSRFRDDLPLMPSAELKKLLASKAVAGELEKHGLDGAFKRSVKTENIMRVIAKSMHAKHVK